MAKRYSCLFLRLLARHTPASHSKRIDRFYPCVSDSGPIAGAKIGADIAQKLDGHSLAEHLRSSEGVFQRDRLLFKYGGRRESGFAEKYKYNQAAVHHGDLMAIRIDSDCGCKEGVCVRGRAISNGRFKPMVYTSKVEGTAFHWAVINGWSPHNVKRDPECRNNLAATDAKTLERLSTAYDQ